MWRIVRGGLRCLNLAVASLLLTTALWVIGGQQFPGPYVLAFHAVTLLVAIVLVVANRTRIALAVAVAPGILIIATFVAFHMGREMLTKPEPPKPWGPADPAHPQHAKAPSQAVTVEVLETKNYAPVWVHGRDDWSRLSWDTERDRLCKTMLKRDEAPGDWLLFTQDPTATRRAWQSGPPLCEPDAVWFPDYRGRITHDAASDRAILTKFTAAGDFVYRLSFEIPTAPYLYAGHIMAPTFKPAQGYLYFEWWNTSQAGMDQHVQRSMKVRIREPSRLRTDPPA